MKFLVQPVRKRCLHCMVLLRVLEKLDIGFLILSICLHGGFVEDAGEHAAMIDLLVRIKHKIVK